MWKVDMGGLRNSPGGMMRLQLEGTLPAIGEGDQEISFFGPAQVNLELRADKNVIMAVGTVQVTIQLNCSRCLEQFELKLEAPFEETYYYAGEGKSEWIFLAGDFIDLEPEIIKSILLEVPMKILCHEDCLGLCASCGQNLNKQDCNCLKSQIDPRLASLKELLTD